MKKILSLFLCAAFCASLIGQNFLVEEVKADPNSLNIPYKRYELPNGLNVLIHEDHSDPIVHVEVTYHVGSARESMGKSGFAHLFEHMMFQGSGHVADEEHFKIIQGAGGQMNGTTNRDRTNYFETVPSNYLEMALYLESDRMGYLLDSLTSSKFENQRSTVKNEKDQRYGVPYGMVEEKKDLALYGSNGHPYSWPVIGYTDDLDRVQLDDVKKFFLRWYGPNNATLVISGDVDPAATIAMVNKYFGTFTKGPDVVDQKVQKINLPEESIITFKDWIYFPYVKYTFPTVPSYHKDEPALDILADLMAGSKKSIFYKTFIEDRDDYLQAAIGHPTYELAGEWEVDVVSYPGLDLTAQLKKTRDLITETINKFGEAGFSDEDLQIAIKGRTSNYYNMEESIAGKSSVLSSLQVFTKGKKNIQDMVDAYNSVTKEDVMKVYNQYIKNKNSAIVQVIPNERMNIQGQKYQPVESFNQYASVTNDPKDIQYRGLTYKRSPEGVDRSIRPEIGAPKVAVAPTYWKETLPNGLEIYGTTNPGSLRTNVSIEIKGGQLMESDDAYPLGTARLTASMMNEGTQKYTAAEIEEQKGKLGTSIGFFSGVDAITGRMSFFNNQLAPTMALLEQQLLNPNFDVKQFKKDQKAVLESFKSDKTNTGLMAQKGWAKIIYGDNTILGESVNGTAGSVYKMSVSDLSNFHRNNISPNVTRIIVVGNVTKEEFLKSADFLKSWENKNVKLPTPKGFPDFETNQVFMINNPSARQSEMRIGYRVMPFDAFGDFYKMSIANFPLGGNFNSRINLSLREKYGWTYGARSFATQGYDNIPGFYGVFAGIKRSATDSAIAETLRIITDYATNGITQEELDFTKKSLISSDALAYESSFGKANYIGFVAEHKLPNDYRKRQIEILNSLDVAQVNEIIKKYIKPDEMIIFVVGNEFYVKDGITALGYGKPAMLKSDGSGKKKIKKKK